MMENIPEFKDKGAKCMLVNSALTDLFEVWLMGKKTNLIKTLTATKLNHLSLFKSKKHFGTNNVSIGIYNLGRNLGLFSSSEIKREVWSHSTAPAIGQQVSFLGIFLVPTCS